MIHLALIFLFAFTQTGVAAHEISHFSDQNQHSQQDPKSTSKQSVADQCEQCLHYAKVASGLAISSFAIPLLCFSDAQISSSPIRFTTFLSLAFAARAPPQILSI